MPSGSISEIMVCVITAEIINLNIHLYDKGAILMKKILALLSIVSVIALQSAACAAEDTVIKVNGTTLESEQPAVIYNDRTLIPMRDIFEAIGASVGWNENSGKAVAVKGSDIVEIPINENVIYKNGTPVEIDVPAMIVNDRTMIPVRAVSEALGCDVDWKDGIVSINADTSHNPVLVDFAENQFENTDVQIRIDNGGISDDVSFHTAKNKLLSYAFIDVDYDGEEELIISSIPDVKSPNLEWWGADPKCLSIWECNDNGEVVNIFAKETVPHRNAYKPFIAVSDGKICLIETYHYSSSGCLFARRQNFNISGGKLEKADGLAFEELFDVRTESEYNEYLREGNNSFHESYAELLEEDGEKYVKLVYGDTVYTLSGEESDRETVKKALDDYDSDCTVIFSCFDFQLF